MIEVPAPEPDPYREIQQAQERPAEGAVFDTFPEAFAFAWAQLQSAPSR